MTILEIKSEPFSDQYINGYVHRNNLTKWTAELCGHSLKFLGRTVDSNKPLIIGFHGWLNNQNFSFYDLNSEDLEEASLVFPQDRCGFLRAGSWYLGDLTPCNHFTYPVLTKLFIQYLVEILKPSKIIAFGSSMGGFGAWSLSTYYKLDEVYLCVPQTTLNPKSHYFNRDTDDYSKRSSQSSKHLKALGLNNLQSFKKSLLKYPFIDVTYFSRLMQTLTDAKFEHVDLANKNLNYCFSRYYHLIFTRYDHHQDIEGAYFRDMCLPLITALSHNNICFSSAVFPFSGHDAYALPSQILNYSNSALHEVLANNSKYRLSAKARLTSPPYWKPFLVN